MSNMVYQITATEMFVQQFVQVNIKENIKGLHYWPFVWEITSDQLFPLTRGQFSKWIMKSPSLHPMTSSNGNIFRITGHLCGEFTGPGEYPAQRPETRSFEVFFDLRLNKRLSKQSWDWWFETL